ncbi:MAG: hypothetical protein BMS9Abin37_3032 [Acidobacteriota bacterium]|nr:MAG: hypothetical protein BMS9Abin37_3032 [Acidobacteriota bacterium]
MALRAGTRLGTYEILAPIGAGGMEGETVSNTIAKILEREPDWRALPERTPMLN